MSHQTNRNTLKYTYLAVVIIIALLFSSLYAANTPTSVWYLKNLSFQSQGKWGKYIYIRSSDSTADTLFLDLVPTIYGVTQISPPTGGTLHIGIGSNLWTYAGKGSGLFASDTGATSSNFDSMLVTDHDARALAKSIVHDSVNARNDTVFQVIWPEQAGAVLFQGFGNDSLMKDSMFVAGGGDNNGNFIQIKDSLQGASTARRHRRHFQIALPVPYGYDSLKYLTLLALTYGSAAGTDSSYCKIKLLSCPAYSSNLDSAIGNSTFDADSTNSTTAATVVLQPTSGMWAATQGLTFWVIWTFHSTDGGYTNWPAPYGRFYKMVAVWHRKQL